MRFSRKARVPSFMSSVAVTSPKSVASCSATSPRGYHVLGELGTRPAVTYLKKILREEHA